MPEDSPKYNPRFEDQSKGFAIGDGNIIYNYFGYREDIESAASVDSADENLPCPYRGLYHFSPNDAEYFFGRDVFIKTLLEATQTRNFISILGASGSGKSSVILAGLISKLEQEQKGHWKFTHFRPGSDPFYALALALVPLYTPDLDETEQIAQTRKLAAYLNDKTVLLSDVFAKIQQNHFNHRILLIADQFEEIYTQCSDPTVRRRFLNCLLASFQSSNSGASFSTVLVTTMRVDFLANALAYRPFADMLQNADVKLGVMSREELKEVIEKPAEKLGVFFEAGLVERILNDVENEPGNLPLLEFALTELWKKRTGKQLTHGAYEAIGQVKGALADYADDEYKKLTSEEQEQARRIFIQLVRPGEGTEDTRRLANRGELREEDWDLITRQDGLADSRLIVTSRNDIEHETAEVVHEALIQNWVQLRKWMETDRKFRLWQEQLRAAIRQWENTKQDNGSLFRGITLAEAENWQRKRKEELSQAEQMFIQISIVERDKEKSKEERRQKNIIVGLASFSAISLSLFGGALWQWHQAQIQEIHAHIKTSEAFLLSNQSFDALIASVKAGKQINRTFGVDAKTQIQATGAIQNAFYELKEYNRLPAEGTNDFSESQSFALSPDGETIITRSDGTVRIWNLKGQLLHSFSEFIESIAFSPDGQIIASGGSSLDNKVRLWDSKEQLLSTFNSHTNAVNDINFSPDGQIFVTASRDNTLKIWDLNGELLHTLKGHDIWVLKSIFSPDGQIIASTSDDGTVKIWNLKGQLLNTLRHLPQDKYNGRLRNIKFSSDSKTLVSTSDSANVYTLKDSYVEGDFSLIKIWDINGKLIQSFRGGLSFDGKTIFSIIDKHTVQLLNLKGEVILTLKINTHKIIDIGFNPERNIITSVSGDNTIKLWSLNGELLQVLEGHSSLIRSIKFSPDSQTIASAGDDGTIRLWNLKGKLLKTFEGHTKSIKNIEFGYEGNIIISDSGDKTVRLWYLNKNLLPKLKRDTVPVNNVKFSPDGQTIASSSTNGTIRLWSLKGELLHVLKGHKDRVHDVRFSPDGQTIASAGDDGTIRLWNLEGELLHVLTEHKNSVFDVRFSPDGQTIASGSTDGTIKLWNLGGELLHTINIESRGVLFSIEFSTEGQFISSNSGSIYKQWDLQGKLLRTIDMLDLLKKNTIAVKDFIEFNQLFRQDTEKKISFETSGTVFDSINSREIFKLINSKDDLVYIFRGHTDDVNSIEISPDGDTIASASDDGTIRLWSLDLDKILMLGCEWIRDYLENNPDINDKDRDLCNGVNRYKIIE